MRSLEFNRFDVHEVEADGRRLLLHVPTTSLFELDPLAAEVVDFFRDRASADEQQIRARFEGRAVAGEIVETLKELLDLGVIGEGGAPLADRRPRPVHETPLSTIVLNVNTGCNLSCTYCYKEDLTTPAAGERMSFETAAAAFELLLGEGRARRRVNVVFFGGEPLTNVPLIREVVAYAERRGAEAGKTVDFSLTTNGTLLTDDIADYLDEHRFGLTVSMDGPKALHDRARRTIGGAGTYEIVARNVRRVLSRYRSRPIGARVTLVHGVTDVVLIHRHLREELGFFEVGFSPATSGGVASFRLSDEELTEVFRGMKVLGNAYLEAALRDENIGFGNMHQLMSDLRDGRSKALPCGAGVGMLAVDRAGDLHLCHRFTGSEMPRFGDLAHGVDRQRLSAFLEGAQDRDGKPCATCRIRNLCAGGCYHESYARYGDPLAPVAHYCDILRDWIDFGMRVYARLSAENPGFFERHLEGRRAEA